MSTETAPSPSESSSSAQPAAALRVWPAVVLVTAFWLARAVSHFLDMTISGYFLQVLFTTTASFLLLFFIWWLSRSAITRRARFSGFAGLVALTVLFSITSHESIGPFTILFFALPIALSVWTLWLAAGGKRSALVQQWGAALALLPLGIGFESARMTQLWGNGHADFTWRWTPALYKPIAPTGKAAGDVKRVPGEDWPGLRGPERNGEVHGVRIAANWSKSPPKRIWRADIGPAWSSFAVVGNRLFTQEQRDDQHEAVVCFDAATGEPLWVHQDEARHYESQGGAGPRGTPTFANGRVFTLGATGILNCLDAVTGEPKWQHNIREDSDAKEPMWGFSCSPLVVGDLVVVYAGGGDNEPKKHRKGMLAYRTDTSKVAWAAEAGKQGYSSPQLLTFDGQSQIVMFDDKGLIAVEPETGHELWRFESPTQSWRVVQPHAIGKSDVVFGSEDLGLIRLEVKHDGQKWTAEKKWASTKMYPAYSDFVVLEDSLYGFDREIFCCIDLETGKRRWREGRFGHGQAILLADGRQILVLAEDGQAVLIAADPAGLMELGRFQALEGKTWNHPVIAHGRLFVRNDHDMACFDVKE